MFTRRTLTIRLNWWAASTGDHCLRMAGATPGTWWSRVNRFRAGQAAGLPPSTIPVWAVGTAQSSANVTLSRGIDINDDGTILASYSDSSGNVSTYLLTPTP